jgi:hypothetical protein
LLHRDHRFYIFVRLARPEEPFEAVFAAAWHDMDMQMGDTLADAIVDGDEGAMGL